MIITGNNIEVLRTYADNTFDSVVTDPPYGLSFMGKKWDYDVPSIELWKEVLRVLKPGGHMLCACGTRTQHRMVVNIEDAGFEIRDVITWHYGSGFPKSLDIGKAIDKAAAGAEREVTKPGIVKRDGYGEDWDTGSSIDRPRYDKPSTDAAKQWNGFGTALKPATELWTLARKPLSCNTIAENVLKYGTGGLNIDGCRIEGDNKKWEQPRGGIWETGKTVKSDLIDNPQGRFPANLVFSCDCEGQHEDGCPVGELDRQSGVSTGVICARNPNGRKHGLNSEVYGEYKSQPGRLSGHNDTGGASRFFYVAKSSKSERNKGLNGKETNSHPTIKPVTLMRYLCRLITPPKGIILDPFNGSGTTGIAAALEWFEYVGIEQEQDYSKISQARQPPPDLFT